MPINGKNSITKDERVEFARELLKNGFNQTQAYKKIRPHVTDGTAKNNGKILANRPGIISAIRTVLAENDLSMNDIAKKLNVAISSGLGKKATNRDAIAGLKLAADIHLGHDTADLDGIQRQDLEEQSVDDLVAKLDQMKHDLLNTKKTKAVDGEIVDSK